MFKTQLGDVNSLTISSMAAFVNPSNSMIFMVIAPPCLRAKLCLNRVNDRWLNSCGSNGKNWIESVAGQLDFRCDGKYQTPVEQTAVGIDPQTSISIGRLRDYLGPLGALEAAGGPSWPSALRIFSMLTVPPIFSYRARAFSRCSRAASACPSSFFSSP